MSLKYEGIEVRGNNLQTRETGKGEAGGDGYTKGYQAVLQRLMTRLPPHRKEKPKSDLQWVLDSFNPVCGRIVGNPEVSVIRLTLGPVGRQSINNLHFRGRSNHC